MCEDTSSVSKAKSENDGSHYSWNFHLPPVMEKLYDLALDGRNSELLLGTQSDSAFQNMAKVIYLSYNSRDDQIVFNSEI